MNVLSQPQYEYLKGIVTVAINTGLRRQNILDLTWKQIHLADRVIEITRNKSNKHIIKRAWRTVKEKAGIVDFRFHDLRHTVGTRLAQMNVSIPVIQQVLDHSDIKKQCVMFIQLINKYYLQ